jgi:acetyl esterase/lipase
LENGEKMRGIISEKLHDFIKQANIAGQLAKADGVRLTPSLVRKNIAKLSVFIGEGPPLPYAKDSAFETLTHRIGLRIYSPNPEQALPVVLYYHGGGHMCGNIALYDPVSRRIAKSGHCIVIAVEYRLAPEFPYPSAIDDCQYVLAHYKKLLTDVKFTDHLVIAGDSCGGAICATLASKNIGNVNIKIDKQVLIYPSVDYSMSSNSIEENGSGFLLEKEKIVWYFDNYFQRNEPYQLVSPLFMPMDTNMPETIIFTAGCDPLRDEGFAYGQALSKFGVKVEQHSFDGMIHAYLLLHNLIIEECEKTYQLIGEFIGRRG